MLLWMMMVVGRQCLLFVDDATPQQHLLRSVYSFQMVPWCSSKIVLDVLM
jgi:polysaccharide deacetylase 2 family uncharacterized protein YibQ